MYMRIRPKSRITADTLILIMGLIYPAIHNYIWRAIVALTRTVGIDFSNDVFDTIVWTIIIGYIVMTARETAIPIKVFALSLLFVFVAILSFTLTDYEYFSWSVLFTLLLGTLPFFVQGALINMKRVSYEQLYIAAIFTLIISLGYSLYSVGSKDLMLEDNMDFAYKVLPSILIIISWLFTNREKKSAIVFSIIGIIFLLLQGTRGPMLCLAAFVCLMLYKKQGIGKFVVSISAVVLLAALIISAPVAKLKMAELSEKIDSTGYSSRFIVMMLEGELSDDNGRDAIKERLLDEIAESPFEIRGLFADRQATRGLTNREYGVHYWYGTYAHSLWIELLYDWGTIFGSLLLIFLVRALLKLVRKCHKDHAYIVMIFVCTGFVHLFLSGSYLTSAKFFFLVGLSVNCHRHEMSAEGVVA